jgi:hypothetical protein
MQRQENPYSKGFQRVSAEIQSGWALQSIEQLVVLLSI